MEPPVERPSLVPSLGPPGSRRRRLVFFAITGSLLIAILVVFREVLAPFAIALVLAYVFAPVVNALQRIRIGERRLPRWIAVVILYAALLGAMAAAIAFGAPRLAAETQRIARELPRMVETVQDDWVPRIEQALSEANMLYAPPEPGTVRDDPDAPVTADLAEAETIRVVPHPEGGYEIHLPENGIEVSREREGEWQVAVPQESRGGTDLARMVTEAVRRAFSDTERYAGTALRHVQTFVAKIVGGIFSFFITLMLSAYMLITSDRIFAFFRSLAAPDRRDRFDDLLARIDRGLAGVVRGQLLIAVVNGVLSGIGFWLFDLKYWPLLTLVATVLSIIPIFGAIISSIPAVLVGLQNGLPTALFVLAWIVGIHQLEANVLNPKIMGDAAKVHPVLVVFALLAGEHFFGIAGALLAVPVLSITQSLFLHFREVALGVPSSPALAKTWTEAPLDRPPTEDPPAGA